MTGSISLRDLLDREALVDLAGSPAVKRGERYAKDRRVGPISEADGAIEAAVQGERRYKARIWEAGLRVRFECDCPVGLVGVFCKHCVALAIVWLDPSGDESAAAPTLKPTSRRKAAADTVDPVPAYLAGLSREALVDLIFSEAGRSATFRERLQLSAAASGSSVDVKAFKQSIDRATSVRGFLEYRQVPDYARRVDHVADLIEGLAGGDGAEVAIGLAEHVLNRLEKALHKADDSDGLIGDLVNRLQDIHLLACKASRPNLQKLAERLFRWEMEGDWDVFRGAAETYADVLGEAGLATYRRLAEAEWVGVPFAMPARDGWPHHDSDRFAITYAMRALARALRDVDMEISVMSRDLSSAYSFLEIARVCRGASRPDEALAWAERGMSTFATRTDGRLREFLAEEYLARSRPEEAIALVWAEFTESPKIETYQTLKRFAEKIEGWPEWRSRAIDAVREKARLAAGVNGVRAVGVGPASTRERWGSPPGSTLVEILLSDGDFEAAWVAAQRFDCHSHLWLALARRIEETRPDDALTVYRREIEVTLQVSERRAYADAIGLLRRVRGLMVALDREAEFAVYAAGVRADNSRRPTFLSLFDAVKLVSGGLADAPMARLVARPMAAPAPVALDLDASVEDPSAPDGPFNEAGAIRPTLRIVRRDS
jgi:uncharacterized Zn finger protein